MEPIDAFLIIVAALFLSTIFTQIKFNMKSPNPIKSYDWIITYFVFFVIVYLSILHLPEISFYLIGMVFILFILFPIIGYHLLRHYSYTDQNERAYSISKILAVLHPFGLTRNLPKCARLYLLLRDEKIEAVKPLITQFKNFKNPVHQNSYIFILRRIGDFKGIIEWFNENVGVDNLHYYPELILFYNEALGETGQITKMLDLYLNAKNRMQRNIFKRIKDNFLFAIFAFSGQSELVEKLFSKKLSIVPDYRKEFWLATAAQADGRQEEAQTKLSSLLERGPLSFQDQVKLRMNSPLLPLQPEIKPQLEEFFQKELPELEQEFNPTPYSSYVKCLKRSYFTYILVFLLIMGYILRDHILGGSHNLGFFFGIESLNQIVSPDIDWMTSFISFFFHYGPYSLALILMILLAIGPFLENILGSISFLTIYWLSGMCSIYFSHIFSQYPDVLILGPLVCIMGLMGAAFYLFIQGLKSKKLKINSSTFQFIVGVLFVQACIFAFSEGIPHAPIYSGIICGFVLTPLLQSFKIAKPKF